MPFCKFEQAFSRNDVHEIYLSQNDILVKILVGHHTIVGDKRKLSLRQVISWPQQEEIPPWSLSHNSLSLEGEGRGEGASE